MSSRDGVMIWVTKDFKRTRDLAAAKMQVSKVKATDMLGKAFKDESMLSQLMKHKDDEKNTFGGNWF